MRVLLFFVFTALLGCAQENHKYKVNITYTTGEVETLIMIQHVPPKIEKNGCLYDYYEKTYICGVRKIYVLEAGPDD